jgi:hypothetical protein
MAASTHLGHEASHLLHLVSKLTMCLICFILVCHTNYIMKSLTVPSSVTGEDFSYFKYLCPVFRDHHQRDTFTSIQLEATINNVCCYTIGPPYIQGHHYFYFFMQTLLL